MKTRGAGYPDAEDAAQEAMTALYWAWADVESPRAWVRTTASRIWSKTLKSRRRLKDRPLALDDNAASAVCEDLMATEEEERCTVLLLLRRLPPAQQAVVALHYDGFSTKEISGIVDRTEATVRSSLRHGRRRLEQMIAAEGIEMPHPKIMIEESR
jgi:RNA polymerase sigma-70 factor (ECF subfamily)